jgi:hypothetical protein
MGADAETPPKRPPIPQKQKTTPGGTGSGRVRTGGEGRGGWELTVRFAGGEGAALRGSRREAATRIEESVLV